MNARKMLTSIAAAIAVFGFSVAGSPAQANEFERRLNYEAMSNYMNQHGGYANPYYGNVNNGWRNNGWNNRGWNNNRSWNNGWNNNGWNNGRHRGWDHHHHHH